MPKIKKDTSVLGFPEKYAKVLKGTQIIDDYNGFDEEGLKKAIVESENAIEQMHKEMEADANLTEIKEKLKALSEGYRETKKLQTAKIKYALYCLEKMGKI